MTLIDLGPADREPGDEPGAGRGLGRRQVREVGIALIAAVCLLAVTGSARPQPHGVRPLWSIAAAEGDGTMLTRDSVLRQQPEGDITRLTAYDLATGAVRWSRQLPGSIGFVQAADDAGVLLAPTDFHDTVAPAPGVVPLDPRTGLEQAPRQTIALDAGTGAELWRMAGEPQSIAGDRALMTEHDDEGGLLRMRLIRLGDHGTIWSRETPGVQNQTVAPARGEPSRIITADGAGNIKTFRYADGAYLTGARIPWVAPRPQDGFFNDIVADHDYLTVNRTRQDTFDTSVYRLDTLAEAWSINDTNGYAFFCGAALCLNSGSAISSHDLETGRRLWQRDGAGNFWPIIGDRLVLDDGTMDGEPILVDAGTGRPVGGPARGRTVWDYRATDALVLLHTTRTPPGRTSVTRWDLRTGRQHLLGSIDETADNGDCQTAGNYLACKRSGRLAVAELAVAGPGR